MEELHDKLSNSLIRTHIEKIVGKLQLRNIKVRLFKVNNNNKRNEAIAPLIVYMYFKMYIVLCILIFRVDNLFIIKFDLLKKS